MKTELLNCKNMCICLLVLLTQVVIARQLITNPNFSNPRNPKKPLTAEWKMPKDGQGKWSAVKVDDYSIVTALLWDAQSGDVSSSQIMPYIKFRYYHNYELSFALKTTPGMTLEIKLPSNTSTIKLIKGTSKWQVFRIWFNTVNKRGGGNLLFRAKNSAGKEAGKLWITDVKLSPVDFGLKGMKNLALGRPCTFNTPPNYKSCIAPDDMKKLTDGKHTDGYFWGKKSTVAWIGRDVGIIIDLGKTKPISGAAVYSAAGTAGVKNPKHIYMLVSENGKDFYLAGDLVTLSQKENKASLPDNYFHHCFRTTKLQTKGRYVAIVIQPNAEFKDKMKKKLQIGWSLLDEIEIFEGSGNTNKEIYAGKSFNGIKDFIKINSYYQKYVGKDEKASMEKMKAIAAHFPECKEVLEQASTNSEFKKEAVSLLREWKKILKDVNAGKLPEGFWRAHTLVDRSEKLKGRFLLKSLSQ